MAFELPPLPYDYDALEPVISKETMTFHHDKHHAAYTNKLNEAVEADSSLQGKSIEDILATISSAPAVVRNNGGGFWNPNTGANYSSVLPSGTYIVQTHHISWSPVYVEGWSTGPLITI